MDSTAFSLAKKNVVYEISSFNLRKQGENETVDSSVTDLYSLAEHCNYFALHVELIRDRLVLGYTDIHVGGDTVGKRETFLVDRVMSRDKHLHEKKKLSKRGKKPRQ